MTRYVILDPEGKADNVIVWDETTPWSPPEGYTIVTEESAEGQAAIAVRAAEQQAEQEALLASLQSEGS